MLTCENVINNYRQPVLRGEILKKPEGVMVPLVTPFTREKELDEDGLRKHIRYLIDSGVQAVIPNAGTSESVSLSDKEHERALDIVIDAANGETPVISGVIKPGIKSVIESAKYSLDAGADAILLITPYYARPTQEGIYDYFKTVANSVDISIIVYNIPARTGVDVNPQTLAQLSEISQIVGIKECNWELGQFLQKIRLVGKKISVIAGSSPVAVEAMVMGAKGLITGSDNLIPDAWVRIYETCKRGDFEKAKELHRKYLPLFSVLASEPDPAPLKAALSMIGRLGEYVRSPILPIREDTREKIKEILKGLGML